MHPLICDNRVVLLGEPSSVYDPKRITFTPHLTKFSLFTTLPAELRLKIWSFLLPTSRIVKITVSAVNNSYRPSSAPPVLFSICAETRALAQETYTYLQLGSTPYAAIPFNALTDNLYISNLAPILQTHLPDLLYNLSTSPSRSAIRRLAFDLRVWNECCEKGLLGVLGRMRELREVQIVVEFGRQFRGEIGFLNAPDWRSDLRWVAERAEKEVSEEMGRARGWVKVGVGKVRGNGEDERLVVVKCVLLTRGGEQA